MSDYIDPASNAAMRDFIRAGVADGSIRNNLGKYPPPDRDADTANSEMIRLSDLLKTESARLARAMALLHQMRDTGSMPTRLLKLHDALLKEDA